MVEGVVSTVMTRPDEPWLIVYHKAGIDMDFEDEVRARLPMFPPEVHFCHWGAHDATNDFAHVPNVILAGTLFMRLSHYEALGRLASAHPSSRGPFGKSEIEKVMVGEHRHLVLQALCRGAVRKCVGNGCPPTRAYIIASERTGIAKELPHIFPGAKLHPWRPVKKTLKGKVKEAVEFIVRELSRAPWSQVTFRAVMNHIGWTDGKDFKRRIRRHEDFTQALADEGIGESGGGSTLAASAKFQAKPASDGPASIAASQTRLALPAPSRLAAT